MTNDEKKLKALVDSVFLDALKDFIGTKPDPAAIQHEVEKVLEQLYNSGEPGILSDFDVTVDVVHDIVHLKLKQLEVYCEVFAKQIIPTFSGPLYPWFVDGVVHITGVIGCYRVKACDFMRIDPDDDGHVEAAITCLTCLTLNVDTDAT